MQTWVCCAWFLISSNYLFALPGGKHLFQDSSDRDLARGLRVSQQRMRMSPRDTKAWSASLGGDERHAGGGGKRKRHEDYGIRFCLQPEIHQ